MVGLKYTVTEQLAPGARGTPIEQVVVKLKSLALTPARETLEK